MLKTLSKDNTVSIVCDGEYHYYRVPKDKDETYKYLCSCMNAKDRRYGI
mgnify:CR=1 FL=1